MSEQHYREAFGVIIAPMPQWAWVIYRHDHWRKGDTVFLTVIVAIARGDKELLNRCIELLNERRRWPEQLDDPMDAPNLFIEYLDKWVSKYNMWASRKNWRPIIPWRKRYRCVKGMTRDPFVMALAAWYLLDGEGKCPLRVPWWIMRLDFYHWVQWIKTHKMKHKRKYEFWASLELRHKRKLPVYVTHLEAWKSAIIESNEIKDLLAPFVPDWNYLCLLLINDPLLHLHEQFIKNYRSRSGYQWASDNWINPEKTDEIWLEEGQTYRPDKEILDWAIQHHSELLT